MLACLVKQLFYQVLSKSEQWFLFLIHRWKVRVTRHELTLAMVASTHSTTGKCNTWCTTQYWLMTDTSKETLFLETNTHLMRIQPLEERWGATLSLTVTHAKQGSAQKQKTPQTLSYRLWLHDLLLPQLHMPSLGTAPAWGASAEPGSAKPGRCCWHDPDHPCWGAGTSQRAATAISLVRVPSSPTRRFAQQTCAWACRQWHKLHRHMLVCSDRIASKEKQSIKKTKAHTTRGDFTSLIQSPQQSHALNASLRWPADGRTEVRHWWRRSAT